MASYKLVTLGDSAVGKTALTSQLCFGHFVKLYFPTTTFNQYRREVIIDGQFCIVEVRDTAGHEEYTVPDQWIQGGVGFVLVYSISSRESFTWLQTYHDQIQQAKESLAYSLSSPHFPLPTAGLARSVPVMLVGNKSDEVTEREVSTQEGHAIARKLGYEFVEASAKNFVNVEKAFYDVVRLLRRQRQQSVQQPIRTGTEIRGNKCVIS